MCVSLMLHILSNWAMYPYALHRGWNKYAYIARFLRNTVANVYIKPDTFEEW